MVSMSDIIKPAMTKLLLSNLSFLLETAQLFSHRGLLFFFYLTELLFLSFPLFFVTPFLVVAPCALNRVTHLKKNIITPTTLKLRQYCKYEIFPWSVKMLRVVKNTQSVIKVGLFIPILANVVRSFQRKLTYILTNQDLHIVGNQPLCSDWDNSAISGLQGTIAITNHLWWRWDWR